MKQSLNANKCCCLFLILPFFCLSKRKAKEKGTLGEPAAQQLRKLKIRNSPAPGAGSNSRIFLTLACCFAYRRFPERDYLSNTIFVFVKCQLNPGNK
jgi:hypothetical protein